MIKTIPSAGSYKDNLVFNQLVTEMNPGTVFELSNRRSYLSAFTRILSQRGGAMSRSIFLNEITSAYIERDIIQGTIASTTQVGAAVNVTFNPALEGVRKGDKVVNSNRWDKAARVVAVTNGVGGVVTLAPLYEGSTTISTADYPLGAQLTFYGDIRTNEVSGAKERRFTNPKLDFNYLSTSREGAWTARYEKISTRVTTNGSQPNVFEFNGMWYTAQQQQMVERMEFSKEMDIAFSNRDIYQTSEGEVSTNGGIRWTIKNRNGIYLPFSTALTRDVIEGFWQNIHVQTVGSTSPFIFFCGLGLWAAINKLYEGDIRETGKLNTFAGEDVSQFNIPMFTIPGVSRQVAIVEAPFLNDPEVIRSKTAIPEYSNYTTGQMTGFIFTDRLMSWDGQAMPQFTRYHFGQKEFFVGRLKGMDNGSDFMPSGSQALEAIEGGEAITDVATLRDLTEISVLTQSGIDGYGYGSAWIEPII